MTYSLEFTKTALKEWKKLPPTLQDQFKKRLKERLNSPHVESAKLRNDLAGLYKIKLQSVGYRLVYEVEDDILIVLVLGVGKRDKQQIYDRIKQRLKSRL